MLCVVIGRCGLRVKVNNGEREWSPGVLILYDVDRERMSQEIVYILKTILNV